MATIALYAGKMNQVPGLVSGARKSVTDYKSELSAMRTKAHFDSGGFTDTGPESRLAGSISKKQ